MSLVAALLDGCSRIPARIQKVVGWDRFRFFFLLIHGGHMNATVATVASVVTHVPIPNCTYLSS